MHFKDYNPIEREVVSLWSMTELLDSVVNHTMLKIVGSDDFKEVRFYSEANQLYLNIVLVDLLSFYHDNSHNNCENAKCIEDVLSYPRLAEEGSANEFKRAHEQFKSWLNTEVVFHKVWFPDIAKEMDLKITRRDYIKICGNIAKHNPMKLDRVAKSIRSILLSNSVDINIEESYICLNNFFEWFHHDIFIYHSSLLVQMLNDLRWGIHTYLRAKHDEAVEYWYDYEMKITKWKYKRPEELENNLAWFCYWELMNKAHQRPYVDKFCINEVLRHRY